MNIKKDNLEYRSYRDSDLNQYKLFCERNFGKSNYQSNPKHIDWLRSNPTHFFNIVKNNNKILGCFHGFQAPVKIDNQIKYFFSLHDLMVDKDHRSGIGLKLMQKSIFQTRPVILSGAKGRVSRAYKRLGSTKFESQWYKKFILPKYIFNYHLMNFDKICVLQGKSKFKIFNNKEINSKIFIEEGLALYNYSNNEEEYFHWRFLDYLSPLTFFMIEDNNIIIFSIGYKKKIPFMRIFSIYKTNDKVFTLMLKSIEKFASSIGILLILYSITENVIPPRDLKYKKYQKIPDSYFYSLKKYDFSNIIVNGFSTDTGFESYNF
jgi:hypothetical protein